MARSIKTTKAKGSNNKSAAVSRVKRSPISKPAAKPVVKAVKQRLPAVKKALAKKAPAKKAPAKKKVPAKKAAPKTRPASKRQTSVPDKSVSVPVTAVPKLPKKAEKKAKKAPENTVKGYSKEQLEKYKEQKIELKNKGNQELKDVLRKNDQSMSGNKDELIEKVADGIVLGKIPRCPSCFGGRLRFDYKSGVYNCPGYRDDVEYHNCHKKYNLSEITRDPWTA